MECAAIVVVVVVVWGVPGVAPAAGGAAAIVVTNKLRTRASAVACLFLCVQAGFFFVRLGAVPSFSPIATPIIKRRICVENVPGVEMLGIIK